MGPLTLYCRYSYFYGVPSDSMVVLWFFIGSSLCSCNFLLVFHGKNFLGVLDSFDSGIDLGIGSLRR